MKRYLKYAAASLTAVTALVSVMPAYASTADYSYRKRVIGLTGIVQNINADQSGNVTRGEFARMLVKASKYKDYLPESVSVSVYNDVLIDNAYAPAVQIATDNGWMNGYLGGYFKPDQPITLKEAVKGVLALLGYTDSDFAGNSTAGRMALYYSLNLNEEIDRKEDEVLTGVDCINLFYNLLKTKMKDSGTVYGTVIGCTVNSDGEINPMELADSSLVGPKLVGKSRSLGSVVPFNVREASIYVNGEAASYETASSVVSDDYCVVYYNQSTKAVWIYTADTGDDVTGRCVVRGKVSGIVYQSSSVMTPSAVILDDDDEISYKLEGSEVQFAFSLYGSISVGDRVALVCEKTGSNGNYTYTVVDFIED